ncbi:MAG: tRNA pseudouridine(55) synthase TruB [Isosphaeraceae bacterium]
MMNPSSSQPATSGVLNLNKPTGVTSRNVVDQVARLVRKTKVGHAGTLDPLATGVLVVCVGSATRLIEYVQRMPKTYRTVVRLGATSDTLDADGQIVEGEVRSIPSLDQVEQAVQAQVGSILQRPPEYSALKVAGKRAYDLARAGVNVELAPRPVRVDRVAILSYEWPRLELEIDCGAGTYIRSIARDVGESLGTGGLVEVLTRTAIGPFRLGEALDPRSLSAEALPGLLLSNSKAVSCLPSVKVTDQDALNLARGRAIRVDDAGLVAGELAVFTEEGSLVAIAEADPATGMLAPRRVLSHA